MRLGHTLGEIDGRHGRYKTNAEAIDEPAYDHLRKLPRQRLQNGAHGIAEESQSDGSAPSQLVPQHERGYGAHAGAEEEAARC